MGIANEMSGVESRVAVGGDVGDDRKSTALPINDNGNKMLNPRGCDAGVHNSSSESRSCRNINNRLSNRSSVYPNGGVAHATAAANGWSSSSSSGRFNGRIGPSSTGARQTRSTVDPISSSSDSSNRDPVIRVTCRMSETESTTRRVMPHSRRRQVVSQLVDGTDLLIRSGAPVLSSFGGDNDSTILRYETDSVWEENKVVATLLAKNQVLQGEVHRLTKLTTRLMDINDQLKRALVNPTDPRHELLETTSGGSVVNTVSA